MPGRAVIIKPPDPLKEQLGDSLTGSFRRGARASRQNLDDFRRFKEVGDGLGPFGVLFGQVYGAADQPLAVDLAPVPMPQPGPGLNCLCSHDPPSLVE